MEIPDKDISRLNGRLWPVAWIRPPAVGELVTPACRQLEINVPVGQF